MKFLKMLSFSVALILAATAVKADYDVTEFKDGHGHKTTLLGWDGSSHIIQLGSNVYTISASSVGVGSTTDAKFTFNVTLTSGTTPGSITYAVYDNSTYGPFAAPPTGEQTVLTTTVSGFSGRDAITATGDFAPTDLSPDTSNQAKSVGPDTVSTVLDGGDISGAGTFNLAFLKGNASWGTVGHTLTSVTEVHNVATPEPASMLIGLVGIPCMGGLVRMARRRKA